MYLSLHRYYYTCVAVSISSIFVVQKIRAVGPTLAERALHGSRARLFRGKRVVGLVDSVGLRNRAPLLFVAVYSEKNC